MAGVIDGILQDKESIKRQLGDRPEITTAPKRFVNRYRVKHYTAKIVSKTVADSSFILNSSSFGLLGQNKLGGTGIKSEIFAVLPSNNLHAEFFSQDLFIDNSNSTGTINTSNERYSLQEGDVLQSEVIAKFREPITAARFKPHNELDDNANIYLSNNSGATWHSVLEGELFTFPSNSADDELKYKIVANKDVTITKPLKIEAIH